MATGVPSREEPNLYELSGDGMEITYSTSSFAGRPQFSYRDAQYDVSSSGDEIRVVESEIGRQVTVTLDEVPDLHTVTVTLLIPTINLEGRESSFATVAILTTARTSIVGPGLVQGPVQSYQYVALKGTARQVDFLAVSPRRQCRAAPRAGDQKWTIRGSRLGCFRDGRVFLYDGVA